MNLRKLIPLLKTAIVSLLPVSCEQIKTTEMKKKR